ncbi:MAG: NifU family protein [Deltaproteobacteria bacterium]|nr:NifU family protein [Deltaproteobacteria bacterium]
MRRKVEALVEQTLRPLVEADGGSLTIVEVTDARIEIHLGGACAGCPGLTYTRRELLEPLLRQTVGAGPHIEIHSRRLPRAADAS